jgi:hypothetical protein
MCCAPAFWYGHLNSYNLTITNILWYYYHEEMLCHLDLDEQGDKQQHRGVPALCRAPQGRAPGPRDQHHGGHQQYPGIIIFHISNFLKNI